MNRTQVSNRRAGFTLAEVMIAVLLLAIGLSSVAALIPLGARLQRVTADDMEGNILAANAETLVRIKGIARGDLGALSLNSTLTELTQLNNNGATDLTTDYHPSERVLTRNPMTSLNSRPTYEWIFAGRKGPGSGEEEFVVLICRRPRGAGILSVQWLNNWNFEDDEDGRRRVATITDTGQLSDRANKYPAGTFTVDDLGNVYRIVGSSYNEGTRDYRITLDADIPAGAKNFMWVRCNAAGSDPAQLAPTVRVLKFGPEIIK